MNAIGMFVPSPLVGDKNTSLKVKMQNGETSIPFSQVLQQQGMGINEDLIANSGNLNKLLELLSGISEDTRLAELTSSEEMLEPNLEQMFADGVVVNPAILAELQSVQGIKQLDAESFGAIKQQLANIMSKFESLLSEINNQDDIRKVAPKILELLKQWTGLENKLIHASEIQEGVESTSLKVNQTWNEILLSYQNRSKLTSRQHYQSESEVTSKDVVKWMEHALQNQSRNDSTTSVQHINIQTNVPMPKLEQYVIYVNQNQNPGAVESQLIEQFQQVMKTSKFLSMPNGVNQLSIALRPDNLGEMMVRLTEINGEMTVKIVVTSQAAKEMLESNINQLRHMFSPQQVVIERQDLGAGQTQNQTKDSDEQSLHSQDQNQSQSQSDETNQQGNNSNESDFEAHLDELLQNVKV
ncbi:flagellar hook-length control protein FliK [Paucisalibacillus globulus]|uniref:flagellar hook-length control protein FliK n=1 Tax=Paucisalibacillus globulus TaxID=351095 RepID=UPI000BB7E8FC|nr:flagellar hook-length control protein FliK [Paucisalibacillus globulus]